MSGYVLERHGGDACTRIDVARGLVHLDHRAESWRVWVSSVTAHRWASVQCSCGAVGYARWEPDTRDYFHLLVDARSHSTCQAARLKFSDYG